MRYTISCMASVMLLGAFLPAQRLVPSAAAPDAPSSRSFRLGVNGRLWLGAIAVDASGNVYVTGGTSAELPVTNPEMPKRGSANRVNAFVMKFDPNGRPLWSSFIGGSTGRPGTIGSPGGDYAVAIAVDPAGQALIGGRTTSTDFPVVNAFLGVPHATGVSAFDGFVAKLSADGKRLIYSSYFGGRNGDSRLVGVAAGPAGEAWVAGSSTSNEIATHFDVSNSDSNQVIVLKLNPAGGVVWSTRMSGRTVYDFAVDALGQPHVTAGCASGACGPFVAKLSASGSPQLYRERVSTGQGSGAFRMSLGPAGEAVVSGPSGVSAAADPWPADWSLGTGGFVRVLDASGRTLSSNAIGSTDVQVLMADRLFVAFNTVRTGLPTERALVPNHVDGPFFVSDDGAATWSNIGGTRGARAIHVDSQRDQLFAVISTELHRSDDGGRTWLRDSYAPYFAVDPRQPNIQWATFGPVFRRVDGGAWQAVSHTLGPSPNTATTLAVSPHDGSAWVGGDFGVEVVAADGRTHRFENDGFPLHPNLSPLTRGYDAPRAFAFDARDPAVVYAGTSGGLYGRSASGGGWVNLTAQLGGRIQAVIAAAVDPANSNVLLIARHDAIYRSVDRGRNWQPVLSDTEVRSIVPDPNRAGVIYAAGHGIYRSLDHGATWHTASQGYESRFPVTGLAINPRTSRLYASSEDIHPLAYVMAIGRSGSRYTRPWATYLADGPVFDVAATLSGAAVFGLATQVSDRHSEVTIVQIGQ